MLIPSIIVIGFVATGMLFALGRRKNGSAADFALAGRGLSGFGLLATLAASNLSAFTVFGVSGAAYRSGWAFFPVMAFGTAFMALSFAYIGVPLRRLAAEGSWVTPGDFIAARFKSKPAGMLFSALSLAFTVPYLAMQAASGGRLIAGATGMPFAAASALLVGVVTLYVFRGGLKAVVRTDILQLAALVGLGLAAAVLIALAAARPEAAALVAADAASRARNGADASLPWTALAGYYLLWSLADPMFPHFMQRFFAARDDRALYRSMAAYPFVLVLVFLPMTAIGVLGRSLMPGLQGARTDGVFTALVNALAGPGWGALFSIAALAALMSTMDSQLLSCASMLSGDLFPGRKGDGTRGEGGKRAAAAGLALGALAWLVSLRPPEAMLAFLNRAAFPGYAILAPVALAALYAPAVGAGSAMAALVAGAILVAAQAAGLFAPPIPAVFFNAGVQVAVLAFGWLLARGNRGWGGIAVLRKPFSAKWAITFGVFLVAGLELWSFGNTWSEAAGAFGLPRWVWYQALLVLGLGAAFIAFGRTGGRLAARTGPRPSDQ